MGCLFQEGLGFLGGIHDVNVGGLLDLHQGTSPWALHLAPSKQPRDPDGSAGKESSCNVGDPVPFLGWEDPLETETATHSSILAWRIPWTV